jgi:hypothetical protein
MAYYCDACHMGGYNVFDIGCLCMHNLLLNSLVNLNGVGEGGRRNRRKPLIIYILAQYSATSILSYQALQSHLLH